MGQMGTMSFPNDVCASKKGWLAFSPSEKETSCTFLGYMFSCFSLSQCFVFFVYLFLKNIILWYSNVAIDNTWKSTINGVWMETTTTIGGIFHCHIWLAEGISPMSNSFFDGQIPLRNSTPSALGHRFGLAGRGSKPVSLRRVSWAVMAWAHVLQEWPLVPRLTDWMGTNYSWIVFWYGITHY